MSEKIYGQFDLETLGKLADIVNEKDLGEITIIDGGKRITVKGKKCPPSPPAGMPPMGMTPVMQTAVMQKQTESAPNEKKLSGNVVKAPLVGTYYAASAPDKPPFVKVGQQIKKGDVVMIIESMKLMNEVQSDFDGTVAEILVKNGDTVEYDQPIMIIK